MAASGLLSHASQTASACILHADIIIYTQLLQQKSLINNSTTNSTYVFNVVTIDFFS